MNATLPPVIYSHAKVTPSPVASGVDQTKLVPVLSPVSGSRKVNINIPVCLSDIPGEGTWTLSPTRYQHLGFTSGNLQSAVTSANLPGS